ncbi:hypothetical protein PCE1_000803 [Barthelona sp. PCE]
MGIFGNIKGAIASNLKHARNQALKLTNQLEEIKEASEFVALLHEGDKLINLSGSIVKTMMNIYNLRRQEAQALKELSEIFGSSRSDTNSEAINRIEFFSLQEHSTYMVYLNEKLNSVFMDLEIFVKKDSVTHATLQKNYRTAKRDYEFVLVDQRDNPVLYTEENSTILGEKENDYLQHARLYGEFIEEFINQFNETFIPLVEKLFAIDKEMYFDLHHTLAS